MNLLTGTSFLVIWAIMYFFVFEMKRLMNKLESDSLQEFTKKSRVTKVHKWVVFTLYIFGIVLTVLLQLLL